MCCTCNASYNPNVSLSLMRFLGFKMGVLVKTIFKMSAKFEGSYVQSPAVATHHPGRPGEQATTAPARGRHYQRHQAARPRSTT